MIEWRDIKGFEGLYQVSNMGEVRSLDHYAPCKCGHWRLYKGRQIKSKIDIHGYACVGLRKSGQAQRFVKVHRLVAEAFIDNPENKPQVNHLNENRGDNRVENLEWVTAKENINYGKGNYRRRKHNLNQQHHAQHIKMQKEGEVLHFDSIASASRYFGCTVSLISGALHKRGRSKKAKGYEVTAI